MDILVIIGLLSSALFLLLRLCITRNLYERLLVANSFSTQIILIILLFSAYREEGSLVDIALVYSCIGFLSTIAFSYYFKNKL